MKMQGERLYTENYKTRLKEIKLNANKWKVIHVHALKELILLKMAMLPKDIYTFSATSIKVQRHFFFYRNRKEQF